MVAVIEQMCAETHNYFETHKENGTFTIQDGNIDLPFLTENQFFRIVGSKFNDGVYIYSDKHLIARASTWEEIKSNNETWEDLKSRKWSDLVEHDLVDETFTGSVWAMNMPRAFLNLSQEISEYCASEAAKPSPFQSESFGGYSYTKATRESGNPDNSWQVVFEAKLKRYRKLAMSCY